MALQITSRTEESFGILDLTGSLTMGPSLSALREAAREVLSGGELSGLMLGVGDVTTVDSAGLGELTIVYTFASKQKCPIRLVEVNPSLHKVLEMTRLDELLRAAE